MQSLSIAYDGRKAREGQGTRLRDPFVQEIHMRGI